MQMIGLQSTVSLGQAPDSWLVTAADDVGTRVDAEFSGANAYQRALEYALEKFPQTVVPNAPQAVAVDPVVIANPIGVLAADQPAGVLLG